MDSKSSKLSLPFLPEEIIEEILSRLAVKSLLRFRCVSKLWRSLIGSEQFIKTHLQNSSKNTALAHHRLILTCYSKRRQHHSLIYLGNILTFFSSKIIGCCNGLVCVIWQNCILLWNPAIRIFKELPQIKLEIRHTPSYLVNYEFGWDESSGAYKVFVVSLNRKEYMCKVYSSKSNSWKSVESWDFNFVRGKAQFASGKLHWHKVKKNGGMNIVSDIVTFDVKSEEFGKMEVPCPCDSTVRLGVLEGRLCVVSYNKRTHFDVWVMKEDSWVKMMDLLVYEPCQRFSPVKRVLRGLNAEILLLRGSVFSVHNLHLVEEDVLSLLNKLQRSLEANSYIESLVSPL